MPIISGSSTISGITNLSPRINSRAIDNAPGRYPTTLSTGDPDRRGKIYKSFDDTYTISFLTSSSDQSDMTLVQYPTKLLSSSQLQKFDAFSSSPSIESDMITTGSIQAGISDDMLMHNIRLGYHKLSPDARTFKWISSNNHFINEEEPSPFSDDRIYIGTSSFYHTGTLISYDGLRSRLASKISFKVDISANENRVLTKRVKAKLDVADPAGEFNGKDITGFCYYNFSTKKWDQVGLTDPATGNPIPFDFACQSILSNFSQNARRRIHSGTNNFPMQFRPSFHFAPDGAEQREDLGYRAVGTPTVTSFAPFATKYHATGSQTISMSEYINHPFILEKIAVNLPVTAQRKIKVQDAAGDLTLDATRDQDDYVFFVYRQANRTHPKHAIDSKFDVSGSERFLVCSGVMTFYNDTICEKTSLTAREFEPINTPAFSHNFGIPISPDSGTPDDEEKTGVYSGSVRLDLTPSFFNKRLSGRSITPRAMDEPAAAKPENVNVGGIEIFHYWPGGSSALPFMQESGSFAILSSKKDFSPSPSKYTGKFGISASYGKDETNQTFKNIEAESLTSVKLPIEVFDPRVTEGYGGVSDPEQNEFGVMIGGASTIESPYLLLPGDKLVFGMDAAMGTTVGAAAGGPGIASGTMMTSLTGSRLTITAGAASITFFGSQVRAGEGISNISLNQQITSDNVHSSIKQDMTISDQYDIELPSALTGTYIDLTHESPPLRSVHGLVTRNPSIEIQGPAAQVLGRKIVGSFADGTTGTTGSLLRGVRMSDSEERFWDTVMPSVLDYVFRIPENPTYNPPRNTVRLSAGPTGSTAGYLTGTIISEVTSSLPFPYEGNPTRNPVDFTRLQIGPAGATNTLRFLDPEDVSKVLFSRGWEIYVPDIQRNIRHYDRGATGMKYGVLNYRPCYSSAVYRRDRFGQFRDMLEQRPYAKFYKEGVRDGTPSPIEIKFVQALTNQAMDPDNIVQKERDSASGDAFGSQVKKATQSRNISTIASSSIPYID
tara:strand:+ start:4411 stop:7422 length:3012 start_codon:yes stop_codon:yes gene_type:complete